MQRIARQHSVEMPLVMLARRVVLPAGANDRAERVELLRRWLKQHTRFVPDPLGAEYLVEPSDMLAGVRSMGKVGGDCDDVAMLAGSMCRAVGIPARFTAVAFEEGQPYRHVFAEAHDGRDWRDLDVARPMFPSSRIRRALTLEV